MSLNPIRNVVGARHLHRAQLPFKKTPLVALSKFGMKAFAKSAASLIAASVLGWAILLAFGPEQLPPSGSPTNGEGRAFFWIGALLALPSIPLITIIEQFQPLPLSEGWIMA